MENSFIRKYFWFNQTNKVSLVFIFNTFRLKVSWNTQNTRTLNLD